MYDKTLFEAAACGCIVLAASKDFAQTAGQAFYFKDAVDLAAQLSEWLGREEKRTETEKQLCGIVDQNSLYALGARIAGELQ
jgi:glycosyltransferase involved in cell wall biosynthesis